MESNRAILDSHTDLILTLTKIASSAATQEQSQDLKDIMLKILKTNLQTYDIVLNMQMKLPLQIERQQPVMFLDACGRLSPVHLEFLRSDFGMLDFEKLRRGNLLWRNPEPKGRLTFGGLGRHVFYQDKR